MMIHWYLDYYLLNTYLFPVKDLTAEWNKHLTKQGPVHKRGDWDDFILPYEQCVLDITLTSKINVILNLLIKNLGRSKYGATK